MGKEIKRLAIFLAKFAVALLIMDLAAGAVLDLLYSRMRTGERGRAQFAIYESTADIYVFGSSRALYHYDTRVLADSLKMTVYNAGRSNQCLLYDVAVLKMILRRHTPKAVILDLNESDFEFDQSRFELLSTLLPYYRKDEGVRSLLDLVRPGYRYVSWSHAFPYNSSLFAILYRSLGLGREQNVFNGFVSLEGNRSRYAKDFDCNATVRLDDRLIAALDEFARICREKNIHFLAVTSPRFREGNCERMDFRVLKARVNELQVPYVDLSNESALLKDEFMYDEAHLNARGAGEFSSVVAHHLKEVK